MYEDGALSARLERRRLQGARRPAASTPRRLRRLSRLIGALSVALTLVGAGALAAAGVTALGIQQRTVPAIVGMQRIHAWLSDADRGAANAYLAGGSEVTLPELQYQADIADASRELQNASEHDPGGGDTNQRLQQIAAMVDQYEGLVQTANVEDRLGVGVGTVYLLASTSLMHRPGTGILARVDALRDLYMDDLDRANLTLQVAQWMAPVYAALAVVLAGVLVATQVFVRRRFHRRRSPQLVAATLLLLVAAGASGMGAVQARQSVKAAEDRSYARLLNLYDARALLYDANGDESLSLIARDPTSRAAADQAFQAETRRLVDRPLTDESMQAAARGDVAFGGMLADELRAAGAGTERSAAVRILQLYRRFLDIDAAVRARAAQGDEAGAIALALGTDQGQLTFAFADVDWYLGLAIQRLQDQFDSGMTYGEEVLAGTAAVELLALAIAALTSWGLRPRLEEFRAGR
jgi:hypothetical protein